MNKTIKAFMAAALLFGAGSLIETDPVFAQASTTVGSLRGVLKDKSSNNEPAVGATVVATSPALQGEQTAVTGSLLSTAPPSAGADVTGTSSEAKW